MKSNIDAKKKIVLTYFTALNRELLCKYDDDVYTNITFNCLDAISKLITSGDKGSNHEIKIKFDSQPTYELQNIIIAATFSK